MAKYNSISVAWNCVFGGCNCPLLFPWKLHLRLKEPVETHEMADFTCTTWGNNSKQHI